MELSISTVELTLDHVIYIKRHLRQQCVFQSLFAKQHPIATTRALALMENVNVHLDGTPKLTVQVSTKISKLRACVSTGNSQHHVWHPHIILRKQVNTTVICEAQKSIERWHPQFQIPNTCPETDYFSFIQNI